MRAPTSAPPKVDVNPCSEAPIPATAPIGSIAMAPKFDTDKLKAAMAAAWNTTKVHSCSLPSTATSRCSAEMPMKHSRAVCDINRVPSRSTMRELRKAPTPMVPAQSANMMGIKLPRWNTSANICCTMPT